MSIIDFEIEEIQKLCHNVVPNSKIIACTTSCPPLVRVDIGENQEHRQLTVCLRFPTGYPQKQPILAELKSKTLSSKFLDALTNLCEKEARKSLGKPQGLNVLRFIQQYLHDNPLCVCFDEIHQLRRDLGTDALPDQLKLKQRNSTVQFAVKGGAYYYRICAFIPDNYPKECVKLQQPESNLPSVLVRYLNGQSKEIARQCVEPPLRMSKNDLAAFQPLPSLYKSLKFCLEATRDFHEEVCAICLKPALPSDPAAVEENDAKDSYVERVYCGHLFHQGCLKRYLQDPPFPKGGKLCTAKRRHPRSDTRFSLDESGVNDKIPTKVITSCGIRLAHDRWILNPKVAESRWAQKQARQRELQEVVDFLN